MLQFTKKIHAIQFGLLSPEEIRAMSVVEVKYPETIENGVPKLHGLADLKMGTIDRQYLCTTCNKDSTSCSGHFGHIELNRPMFHVGYIAKIKKVLESVCFYCSRIKNIPSEIKKLKMLQEEEIEIKIPELKIPNRFKLNKIWDLNKGKSLCDHCSNKQPLIKKEGLILFAYMKGEESSEGKVMLTGDKVSSIFKKILDSDIIQMGFNIKFSRPEWMILTTLAVCPPSVRPSIEMEGILRGEDDLTYKYADILKSNQNLKKYEEEGAPAHVIRDYEQLVQFHVATLMDNEITGQPQALQRNGRPVKAISTRLKGKEGRVRGNLMGKRVDFSARSVITPDSNISLDQLGVPIKIAMTHTFPERVTSFNIEKLRKIVQNGPSVYPGANYVVRKDDQRIDLKFNRSDIKLEEGYIVERHMLDGDLVLFNRQPSLHKMSMMAHRVKVMEGLTFRLNLSATSPYNADFDGDEMNLHMPQSYNTTSELSCLMIVSQNILSPQANKPVMGIVQDTCLGVYRITSTNVFFIKRDFDFLIYNVESAGEIYYKKYGNSKNNSIFNSSFANEIKPAILRPLKVFTGKQLFSAILPNVNFKRGNVIIVDGFLMTGNVCKKVVGASQGSLIHILALEKSHLGVKKFMDSLQKLVNCYLTYYSSFSVGVGDTIPLNNTDKLIEQEIKNAKNEVSNLIRQSVFNKTEKLPGMDLKSTFESRLTLILNKARDVSGMLSVKSLRSCNGLKQMVLSGSKGSNINISQVTACVGQQNIEGKRIPFGFNKRALPHFVKDDYSAESKGFVTNSYLSGLTPIEFFFHAMGGREGLIDTACKTAETGYIQRRIVKSLEDARVNFDGSIRSSSTLYQFVYGDDKFDATFLESQKLQKPINFNSSDKYFALNENGIILLKKYFLEYLNVEFEDKDIKSTTLLLKEVLKTEFTVLSKDFNSDKEVTLPFNINRIYINCLREFDSEELELQDYLPIFSKFLPIIQNNTWLLFFRNIFNLNNFFKDRIGILALETAISRIKTLINRANITTDEMVGTLAAQSIGEPATQMTLNTFHFAGVAQNVMQGVPRLKELINVAKTIKTPMQKVYLKDGSLEIAKEIAIKLEYTILQDVINQVYIIYDPDCTTSTFTEDIDFIDAYYAFPDENEESLGPWVIRLVLIREKLLKKNFSMDFIGDRIKSVFKDDVQVIVSDFNAEDLIVRVRIKPNKDEEFVRRLMNELIRIRLCGLKGINKCYLLLDDTKKVVGKIKETTARILTEINEKIGVITENTAEDKDELLKRDIESPKRIKKSDDDFGIKKNTDDDFGIKKSTKIKKADEKSEEKWMLQTDGMCLKHSFLMDGVDSTKVYCNDLQEIHSVLGIEAVREIIMRELKSVIVNSGSFVNQRHLSLLADVMTMKGLRGITRHGVNRASSGVLKRASFEETVDILLEAACFAEKNYTCGVTESIMLGQLSKIGTGCTQAIIDKEMLRSAIPLSKKYEFLNEIGTPVILTPESMKTPNRLLFSPLSMSSGQTSLNNGLGLNVTTPSYNITTPTYSPTSPSTYSPTSPNLYSPKSPGSINRVNAYIPTSPTYKVMSPSYTPTTGAYNPVSPKTKKSMSVYSPKSSNEDTKKKESK